MGLYSNYRGKCPYANRYLHKNTSSAVKHASLRVLFLFAFLKGDNKMDYGMIGKREKARRYAEEKNRFLFNKFDLTFHGDNNNHHVTFDNGVYSCDCEFFVTHHRCAHTMALEILLQGMVPETVQS